MMAEFLYITNPNEDTKKEWLHSILHYAAMAKEKAENKIFPSTTIL